MTAYQKVGSGPVILLLHGWGDSMDTYKYIVNELKITNTLISLDLPGFGNTQTPKEIFNLGLYARFVASFLSKIGSPEVYAVIGHSNGGAIAIKALATNTVKAQKLILLASSGVRNTYSSSKKMKRIIVKLLKIPTKLLPVSTQNKIRKMVYGKIGSDLFVAEHLQETFKEIITDDVTDDATRVCQPTLLIYGSDDDATPVSYGKKFNEKIRGSELVVVNEAGHFLHQTDSKEVISLIKKFMDK